MPELPEVETTLRGIAPLLEGHTLTHAEVRVKLRNVIPASLPSVLVGRALVNLRRRNKYILAEVAGTPHTLLVHLGMSGRFCVGAAALGELINIPGSPNPKHDHVVLRTATTELRYNDPRKFGMFDLLPTATLATHPLLAKLGPEPPLSPRLWTRPWCAAWGIFMRAKVCSGRGWPPSGGWIKSAGRKRLSWRVALKPCWPPPLPPGVVRCAIMRSRMVR
jgi:formamidopyrimidine-DNA glycosylase